jgi:hypothetical protein
MGTGKWRRGKPEVWPLKLNWLEQENTVAWGLEEDVTKELKERPALDRS